jgi:CBS domain-containing protein
MANLRELMSTDLVTVHPGATVAEAAQLMSLRHVGSVLVMDGNDDLAGIFTERDIVRALASEFDAAHQTVAGWMTREPVVMDLAVDGREALDRMILEGFRHLPIADGDRIVGVVSIRDLAPR